MTGELARVGGRERDDGLYLPCGFGGPDGEAERDAGGVARVIFSTTTELIICFIEIAPLNAIGSRACSSSFSKKPLSPPLFVNSDIEPSLVRKRLCIGGRELELLEKRLEFSIEVERDAVISIFPGRFVSELDWWLGIEKLDLSIEASSFFCTRSALPSIQTIEA